MNALPRTRALSVILAVSILGAPLLIDSSFGDSSAANSQRPPQEEKPSPQFTGVKGCKLCHTRKSVGGQYKTWKKGPHAKAYATLATEKAKAIAKEKGIADPQKSDQCLKCHVTGHGQPKKKFTKTFKIEEGVGCESCHGAGSLYSPEEKHTGEAAKSKKFGLIHPDAETCKKCHNKESPTYREFDYEKHWKKIDHSKKKKSGSG